jgi:hypothetical protein
MKSSWRNALQALLVLGGLMLASGASIAGSFEDQVRAQWRGAWVVVGTEVYSDCTGRYYTNKLSGTLVTNRGGHRFLPGEIGKVQRVQVKKKKVDLMVSLDEPLLISHQDGPFTLYNARSCAISLEIQLPRTMTKSKDTRGVDRAIDEILDRYDTREAALDSDGWNERETEPFPDDYELTLARHAAWKAEQTNLAIDRKRESAFEQVKSTGRAIDDDPDYLQGLAAGVDEMNRWETAECSKLMAHGFDSVRKKAPEDRRADTDEDGNWRKGYEDGQRLVYSIVLLERLEGCYVPVPSVPGETLSVSQDLTSARIPGERSVSE